MNKLNPSTMLDWLMTSIESQNFQPHPQMQIQTFMERNAWDELHWLMAVIALEIEFKIDIPDQVAFNLDQTFAEFVTSIILEPRVSDPGWTLNRLFLLHDAWIGSGIKSSIIVEEIRSVT